MTMTVAGEQYILNLITAGAVPLPAYYVALVRNIPPTPWIDGDELDEPNTEDYTRAVINNQSGNWSNGDAVKTNSIEIGFTVPTVDWGTLKYWAICTQPLQGDVLWFGQLAAPVSAGPSLQPVIAVGALALSALRSRVNRVRL